MNKRIAWIDKTKGLGIILVILGHLYVYDLGIVIYAFHIPLFFFLGGYSYNVNCSFQKMVRKKIETLWVPYIVTGVLISVVILLFRWFKGESSLLHFFLYDIKSLIIQRRKWTLWFVPVLFWLYVVFFPLKKVGWKATVLGGMIFFCIGLWYNRLIGKVFLPMNLDAVFPCSVYFMAGILAKEFLLIDRFIINKERMRRTIGIFLVNSIVFLIFMVISFRKTGQHLNIFYSEYGAPTFSCISALTGIGGFIFLCEFGIGTNNLLQYVGANSFAYFALHQQIFIMVVNDLVEKYSLFANYLTTEISRIVFSVVISGLIVWVITLFLKCMEKLKLSYFVTGRRQEV